MTTTPTPTASGLTWHTDSLWHSEQLDKLIPAMHKFHSMPLNIKKDRTVPVGGGKNRSYTTLDEIITKVRPLLSECGLFVHQHLAGAEVVTMLHHTSGQFMASKLPFTPMNGQNTNSLQNAGGGLSYLKRYAISALLQIAADEDDDGATTTVSYKPVLPSTKLPLSDERIPEVIKWLANGGTLEQVKAKYILTDDQLKAITQS